MLLEVWLDPVPVEAVRAFLEPLGYRLDWAPETDGVGFVWRKLPLSGTGVRAAYFAERGAVEEGLLRLETDRRASAADTAMLDVTARLMAERFAGVRLWSPAAGRSQYGGGEDADPPVVEDEPPRWYS